MNTALYWFRSDLRLEDNANFLSACKASHALLPIYVHAPQESLIWGFERTGENRLQFLHDALDDLRLQLEQLESDLLELQAPQGNSSNAVDLVINAAHHHGIKTIYCEVIQAPEEMQELSALRQAGLTVHAELESTMIAVRDLPFAPEAMPDQFTQFRNKIEKAKHLFTEPVPAPSQIPPPPANFKQSTLSADTLIPPRAESVFPKNGHPYSSFPHHREAYRGGSSAAVAHLRQYLERALPHSYKATRNQLHGLDYSSKLSPWLALGCISARSVMQELKQFESERGANEGSYWLWFELLWRDYFRVLHLKYGKQLYCASGLNQSDKPMHNPRGFERWRSGTTGESIVDAGMRELKATGYLSNRLRQVVASYLIYDLHSDWRAGAAWFESQLLDYDVYSNQGNWLYIAGKGTDPRGGRRFNPQKQAQDHDTNGSYRALWLSD
ncbi:MAG: DASH family cryptochrome [Polynucleobacter sp.]|nr:DASH family cryptochrome [Polynucleobacter sp.]